MADHPLAAYPVGLDETPLHVEQPPDSPPSASSAAAVLPVQELEDEKRSVLASRQPSYHHTQARERLSGAYDGAWTSLNHSKPVMQDPALEMPAESRSPSFEFPSAQPDLDGPDVMELPATAPPGFRWLCASSLTRCCAMSMRVRARDQEATLAMRKRRMQVWVFALTFLTYCAYHAVRKSYSK